MSPLIILIALFLGIVGAVTLYTRRKNNSDRIQFNLSKSRLSTWVNHIEKRTRYFTPDLRERYDKLNKGHAALADPPETENWALLNERCAALLDEAIYIDRETQKNIEKSETVKTCGGKGED